MNTNLLILGAGQYGAVVRENAEAMGCFDKIAFLDDAQKRSVVGKLDEYANFVDKFPYAFVAIGNADLRVELYGKLEAAGYIVPVIVNSKAYISPSAQLGKGTIVEAGAVVNSGAVVEKGCIICANAVVNHNAHVGECCQIDCNATVPGGENVPAKTYVRCNTCYRTPGTPKDIEGVAPYKFEDGV